MNVRTIVAGAVIAGALACPAQTRADQCKAYIKKGEPAHAVLDNKGFAIETPLLEGFLRLELPRPYVDKILAKASTVPKDEIPAFVNGAVVKNIKIAIYAMLRKKTRMKFECAPLDDVTPVAPPAGANAPAAQAGKPADSTQPSAPKAGEETAPDTAKQPEVEPGDFKMRKGRERKVLDF